MKRRVFRVTAHGAHGVVVKAVLAGQCQYLFSDACTLEGVLAAELRLCSPLRPLQLLDLTDRRQAIELELPIDRQCDLMQEAIHLRRTAASDWERLGIVLRILDAVGLCGTCGAASDIA